MYRTTIATTATTTTDAVRSMASYPAYLRGRPVAQYRDRYRAPTGRRPTAP
jgi:hypothetical protein